MTMLDDTLPTLYIPYPKCGHCYQDVTIDDGYVYCERCLIQWDSISEDATGTPDPDQEGSEVPCEMNPAPTVKEYDHDGKHVTLTYSPCILPSGHESDHLRPHDYVAVPLQQAPKETPHGSA